LCPKGELKTRRKLKEQRLRAETKNEAADAALVIEKPALPTDGFADKVLSHLLRVTQERTQEPILRDDDKDASPLSSRCEVHFGEQSERVVKISVKNTFIEAAIEEDDDEPQPLAVWTKSAPGALLPQRFQFEPKQDDVVASGAVQSLVSTSEDAEAAGSASSDTSSRHEGQRIDWADTDDGDMDPSTGQPEVSLEEKIAMHGGSEGHDIGQCVPCAYFWYKKDGCRLGADCKFCHLCTKGEVKKRKRELIQQLKADGKYRPNFSRRQGK
jgi:hypothetical protein